MSDFWKPYPMKAGGDDIPAEVARLCNFYDGPDAVHTTEHSCTVNTHGLELRFKRDVSGEWVFDEIVGPAQVHVEQMSDSDYWMGLYTPDGGTLHVDFLYRPRRRVVMTGWTE